MTTKIADDSASIAQRLKEIEAEKMAAIMGKPLEGEPTEAPKDIDWTGMYGVYATPSGFNDAAREYVAATGGSNAYRALFTELKSLAHPEWPYTGTPHEWRVRNK